MIFTILCQAARRMAKSKTILVMKLTAILLLAGFLQVSAAGFTQTISLSKQNVSLPKVFREIKKQTGYVFFYNLRMLDKAHPVTINVKNGTLKEVLEQCFADQPVTYRIINKTIVVTERPAPPPVAPPVTTDTVPSTIEVRGKVLDDATGLAVSGANIVVKGSNTGVTSGADGSFTLQVKPGAVLVISFVGYDNKEVTVTPVTTTLTVRLALKANKEPMVEVVVTGYQQIRKESFTGNAVTVSGEELKKVNPQNILQAIQAFDPSFQVAQNNLFGSNPNQLPRVNVRGATSLPSGTGEILTRHNLAGNVNLPTFILDGYEVSLEKVYDLDPNRIESVTILKDAAATTVYGSRAANGVMVITTKAPQEGKLQVTYNYDLNITGPDLTDYHVLNAAEKLEYEWLAGLYEPVQQLSRDDQEERYYAKKRNVVAGVNTYWLSQPLRTTFGQKHSMFIEGGSPIVRYGIDLRYHTMPGVMKGSGRDRYSLGTVLSYAPTKKFLFRNVLSVTQVEGTESPYGSFLNYVRMNPYYPKTDSAGRIIQRVDDWTIDTRQSGADQYRTETVLNPLYEGTLNSFNRTKYLEVIESFSAEWNISRSLRLRSLLSLTKRKYNTDVFQSPFSNEFYDYPADRMDERGSYYFRNADESAFDGNITLTYNRQLGDHFVNLAAGANIRTYSIDSKSLNAIGFSNDRFTNIGFANRFPEGSSPQGDYALERLFGSFLSVNYSMKNKYLADLSVRMDGSSKFGTENKTAPFWALGVGWNLHYEPFLENTAISQLKLRASTGQTGDVSFPPYMAQTTYQYYTSNWYSTGVGAVVNNYGNQALQWQKTDNYDVGLDLGLFRDRIYISSRYYYKLTHGLLADIMLPPSTGFGSYKENLGDMENTGIELNLKYVAVRNRNLVVSVFANMARNQNKILKISNALKAYNDKADQEQVSNDNLKGTPLLRFNEGQSLNTIYAVRSLGIDPENGKEIFLKRDGTRTYEWDVKDIVPVGDNTPTAYGYFGTNVSWKGFLLNLIFYTRFGGEEYNQTLVDRVENADPRYNVDSRVLSDRWKQPGDKALYKNIADLGTSFASDRFVQKDNVLELQSVYLSYDFAKKVYSKLAMKNLRLSFTMNDIWRWSSMRIERGIQYPFARSFTFSIQTSF